MYLEAPTLPSLTPSIGMSFHSQIHNKFPAHKASGASHDNPTLSSSAYGSKC